MHVHAYTRHTPAQTQATLSVSAPCYAVFAIRALTDEKDPIHAASYSYCSLSTMSAFVFVWRTQSAYWAGITPRNKYHHAPIAAETSVVRTTLCSSVQLPPTTALPVAMMLQGWHQTGFNAQTSVCSSCPAALCRRSSACQHRAPVGEHCTLT